MLDFCCCPWFVTVLLATDVSHRSYKKCVIYLHVFYFARHRLEWLKLRSEYLALQKSNMAHLKQSLKELKANSTSGREGMQIWSKKHLAVIETKYAAELSWLTYFDLTENVKFCSLFMMCLIFSFTIYDPDIAALGWYYFPSVAFALPSFLSQKKWSVCWRRRCRRRRCYCT